MLNEFEKSHLFKAAAGTVGQDAGASLNSVRWMVGGPMADAIWFGVAGVLLMAGTAAGHVIWKRRLNLAGITTLPGLLIISTTVGGFLAAPFWWFDLPASFAWDLPPLAARMLSAASLAFGVAGLLVLRRPEQGPCRFYNTMLAFCLVPLAMAAVIFDIERFDFGLPVTYGFFAVVLVLSTSSLSALFPPMEIVRVPRAAKAPEPPSPSLRTGFVFLAAAFGVWGVALFVLPDELSGLWSLWPGDTLTSRLNAATKLALAAAFAMAVRDRQHVAPALLFASVYGFGVLAACLVSLVEGDTGPRGFAAVFGALGATSTAMLAARHRSRDSAP